jgi:hypothetical protein
MAKKTSLPLRIAPLQRVVAEPITDPSEQAALDERRKRPEGTPSVRPRENGRRKSGAARVLALCHRLSAEERRSLLVRLAAQVPAEAHRECLAQLLAALAPELLHQLEDELRPRLAK